MTQALHIALKDFLVEEMKFEAFVAKKCHEKSCHEYSHPHI
jgi:hypothetical protein